MGYSITKGDNGNLWEINKFNGELTPRLPKAIDFENEFTNYFELTIKAEDISSKSATTILHIRIDDLNERPKWANKFKGSVKEVQPTGWQFGATAKAYDPDFEYVKSSLDY